MTCDLTLSYNILYGVCDFQSINAKQFEHEVSLSGYHFATVLANKLFVPDMTFVNHAVTHTLCLNIYKLTKQQSNKRTDLQPVKTPQHARIKQSPRRCLP